MLNQLFSYLQLNLFVKTTSVLFIKPFGAKFIVVELKASSFIFGFISISVIVISFLD